MKYTVLLLRPDYVADVFGQDTYQAWVEAPGPIDAVEKAQFEAVAEDRGCVASDPDDYFVLAIYQGHQTDLNPGNITT